MSLSTLKDVAKKYQHLVTTQPLVLSEIESACRWLSYLASGNKKKNNFFTFKQ